MPENKPIIQKLANNWDIYSSSSIIITFNFFQLSNDHLMQKPEQELCKEKNFWSKQQKKKYLEFITNRLISFEGRAPNNFFIIMSNEIQNSKTPRQWIDFHNHRKHGCSSMIDFIKKVSNEIDQDPAVFIKNHEQTIKRQKEKISCFEGFEKIKSITKVVLQEFLKDFNPYEIIFKLNEIFLKQIVLSEGKNKFFDSSDSLHYRRLETKLYPVKGYTQDFDQEKKKSDNQHEAQEFLGEEFRNKKRILFEKRQQKEQKKFVKNLLKKHWTDTEYLKFLVFLMFYKCQFSNDPQKKNNGLIIKMSKFVKTRDLEGCNSCWQHFLKKYKDIDGVISHLQRIINVSKEQIYEEISNIQDFYQQELERQMVPLNPVKLSLWAPGSKNQDLIRQIIKSKIQFSSLTEKLSECKLEADQEAFKVQNAQITIDLPVMLEAFLIKQMKQVEKKSNPNPNPKEKKISIQQKKKYNDKYEDQNDDQNNITKKKISRRNQAFDKSKKKSRKSQGIYQSDDSIKGNNYDQKRYKTRMKQSISQNIKFVAYLIVNRYYFENLDAKDRSGIRTKLAQYLQSGKNVDQCSNHLAQWKLMYDKDVNKVIDQKVIKFGLTEQMIEERKKICKQIRTIKTRIGDATLQLDHLPTDIFVKKEDLSREMVLSKIQESQPFLSFYLRFQENHQTVTVDQESKAFARQQCTEEKEQMPLKMIKSSLKLAVPEQKFQQLKKSLENNSKKDIQTLNLDQLNNQIKIEVCSNMIYKCIFI